MNKKLLYSVAIILFCQTLFLITIGILEMTQKADLILAGPTRLGIGQGGTATTTGQSNALWFQSSVASGTPGFFTQDSNLTYATTTDTLTITNASTTLLSATTLYGALTGNADTATALANNPTDCAGGEFANAIAANGNLACAVVTASVVGTISTSTTPTIGQLSYWTGIGWPSTLGTVATTSLTASSPLALSNPISVIGSLASALTLSTAGDWTGTFDAQQGSYYLDSRNLTNTGTSTLPQLTITGSQVSDLNTLWDNRMAATSTLPNLTTLVNLVTVGTITSGIWNGTDIAVADGGTGRGTFTSSQLLYGNLTAGLSSAATSTITCAGSVSCGTGSFVVGSALTITGSAASSTLLTDNNIFTGGNIFNAASTTITNLRVMDTIFNGIMDLTDAVVTIHTYPAFTYATSTVWTATTTIPLGPAYTAETWYGAKCFTDAGTLNVDFNDGTNKMNLFNASTTVGTITLTTNRTFTAGEKRYVNIGTPVNAPTKISCTIDKLVND